MCHVTSSPFVSFSTTWRMLIKDPRLQENEAQLYDYTYSCVVNIVRETRAVLVPVCLNYFLSIFGVTKARVERIKTVMAMKGANLPHEGVHLLTRSPETDQR
ncbi:hypothetical protein PoB_003479500 [Plakobranchus ocellatus]|uniref:Uncharacterized protein n=1 Tax=Plakobranchus ocellatus TaxID=259542 RepID=A0AAV4AJE0_9GAST|nr:hypothetical protein PoB_003479500 [Plakobranchus ocellatus]